jgi:RND superfamily putative drug exporter
MASLLYRLGLGAVRHRFVVIVAWLVALVAVGIGAATLSAPTVNTFKIPGQESTTALDLISKRFGAAAAGATAQVVVRPSSGRVTDPATATQIGRLVGTLGALPGVAAASNPLDPRQPTVSPDQTAAYSTVTYTTQASEITDAERAALLDAAAKARATGLTVEVRGDATQEQTKVGGASEGIGVIVALVVLAVTYGSLVAAGMNLLTAVAGVGIGALGITTLTGFVQLQSTTSILAIMLGLAVGIDYALFIVTRFRQELRRGYPVPEAAGMAVGTAGSAVLTAGLTVVIALAGLSVAGIPFLTEMGLAAAGTIVIAVLVAITLVPAMLGVIKKRALPRKLRDLPPVTAQEAGRGFFRGWAATITRRRWISLILAVVALGAVAVPVFSMQTSLSQRDPEGSTQARAAAIIDQHFGPGFAGPLLVLVDGAGAPAYAATVKQQIATLPDVYAAATPRTDQAGNAALITVIPKSGPDSQATVDLVHAIRDRINDGPAAKIYVTGTTAISIDVSQKLSQALPIYLALVVGLAFVLLVLVFRSILVPVFGVLGFLLTIGASLGATTAVFQWGWLAGALGVGSTGPLMSLAPIIIVGILFGLAMDYQVFLVSRMHEAHAHGASPRDAIVTGFRQAAPVVIAAATIMFSVFAGFVPQGNETVKPIAFALATGIVFDAIVVRMIAIPAALALIGRAAWWMPRWLSKLPALDVEGTALEHRPATTATTDEESVPASA